MSRSTLIAVGVSALIIGNASHHGAAGGVIAAGCALAFACSMYFDRRRRIRNWVIHTINAVLGSPVEACFWGTKIRHGRVVHMEVTFGAGAADHSAKVREAMPAKLADRMGGPVDVTWDPAGGYLTVTRRARAVAAAVDHGHQVERVTVAARLIFGPGTTITEPTWAAHALDSFVVRYAATIADTDPAFRAKVDATVAAKLGRRYTGTWRPDLHCVGYHTTALLPARVAHPADAAARFGATAIPFAEAVGGVVSWDLDSVYPHLIIAGETGAGKSGALRTLATGVAAAGHELRVCDYKRIGLLGFVGWPGVTEHCTELEDIAESILRLHAQMMQRTVDFKSAWESGRTLELPRTVMVIDECLSTLSALQAAHGRSGVAPAVRAFSEIARLGRQPHVHLLVAFQQAGLTKEFTGETRNNFGARILLGKPKTNVAKQMLGITADVTRAADGTIPQGRAIADVGKGDVECQVWWTPDPSEWDILGRADRLILDGLAPRSVSSRTADYEAGTFTPSPPAPPQRLHLVAALEEPSAGRGTDGRRGGRTRTCPAHGERPASQTRCRECEKDRAARNRARTRHPTGA
jgi:hypothetical protein